MVTNWPTSGIDPLEQGEADEQGVVSILDPQENAGPAGRGLGDFELEGCFHLLVVSRSLAIGLQVEAKIEGHCQPGQLAELISEAGGELETPVGYNDTWS